MNKKNYISIDLRFYLEVEKEKEKSNLENISDAFLEYLEDKFFDLEIDYLPYRDLEFKIEQIRKINFEDNNLV